MKLFKSQYRVKVKEDDVRIHYIPQHRRNIFCYWENIEFGTYRTLKEADDCVRRHKQSQYILKNYI